MKTSNIFDFVDALDASDASLAASHESSKVSLMLVDYTRSDGPRRSNPHRAPASDKASDIFLRDLAFIND